MEMPKVSNLVRIEDRNITINVLTYKAVSKGRLKQIVTQFMMLKRLKKNTNYTVPWLGD